MIDWNKVRHVSEGGAKAPLNVSKINTLAHSDEHTQFSNPIDWDKVRHISDPVNVATNTSTSARTPLDSTTEGILQKVELLKNPNQSPVTKPDVWGDTLRRTQEPINEPIGPTISTYDPSKYKPVEPVKKPGMANIFEGAKQAFKSPQKANLLPALKGYTKQRKAMTPEEKSREFVELAKTPEGAFGAGLTSGSIGLMNRAVGGDKWKEVEQAGMESSGAYTAGNIAGNLLKYGGLYGTIGPHVENLPFLNKLPEGAIRTLSAELAKDLAIGTPLGIAESLVEGKRGKELLKETGKGILKDAAWNTAFYGAGKALGKLGDLRQAKKVTTIPGKVGKQTPTLDGLIKKQMNLVDDLRYQRLELGIDTTKQIEQAEKQLNMLRKQKYLPNMKGQLGNLENIQKQMFDEGKQLTPEFARLSDSINKLKKNIGEVPEFKPRQIDKLKAEKMNPIADIPSPDDMKIRMASGMMSDKAYDATKKAPGIPTEFKINTPTGVKSINAESIVDGTGKSLPKALAPDVQELMDDIVKDLDGASVQSDDTIKAIAQRIKDKSGFSYGMTDVYRNFERALPKEDYLYIKANYLDPFDASKKSMIDMQKSYTDDMYNKVVKKLGIGKNTRESAAVQWLGEGMKPAKVTDPQTGKKVWKQVEYTLDDLKREFPTKWKDIAEADTWFRKMYDEVFEQVNEVRKSIYPNNPDKWLKYRKDYYRHFNEMAQGVEGIKNLFETPSQIDPSLVGVSEFTKPKTKWASFMQQRGMGKYKADAVGGAIDYIKASSYATHIDPHISKFRGLAKDMAEATAETRNANNMIEFIQDFANDLAGKTSNVFFDRTLTKLFGRKNMRVVNWMNSRSKSNTVLGNVSSSLMQIGNVPQGIAYVKDPVALTKGAGDYMASIFDAGKAPELYKKSAFLSERYSDELFSRFDTKLLNQPKKFATWLLGIGDEIGTKFIWSSAYNKGIAEGIQNPIKYADDIARKMVAGRGIGEVPLIQKSKVFQLVAPFQVEVGNLWHVMKDFVSEKDFGGLAALFVANYLLNKGMESVRGSGGVFDPIGAIEDAVKEKDTTLLQKTGRLGGEILSNIPLGQNIASIFPEYADDIKTPLGNINLSRKALFGRNDPTRYGTGPLFARAITNPVENLLLPWGGTQARKTIQGLEALKKGGVFQNTEEGEKLKYPVDKTPSNTAKGLLFGRGSFPEARKYYDENQSSLGVNQTILAKETGMDLKELHKGVLLKRKLKNTGDKGLSVSPVKSEMVDYYDNTGDLTVFMDTPQRSFTFDIPGTDEKNKIELTPDQYRNYINRIMRYAAEYIDYSKSFDSYREARSDIKYEYLRKAVNMAESRARKELMFELR